MRIAAALLALALLAGCSSDDSVKTTDATATESTGSEGRPLSEICAETEALVAARDSGTTGDLKTKLEALAEEGDTEAKNALAIFIDAVEASDTSGLEPGDVQGVGDAHSALRQGIESLADRCEAAGSSAFR